MPDLMLFGTPSQKNYATIYDTPASIGAFADAISGQSSMDTPLDYIVNSIYKPKSGGLRFTKQEANEIALKEGVAIKIPDDGIDSDAFYYNLLRQRQRRDLQQLADRKPDGMVASAMGLGAMLGPQVSDPLNLATGLIPIVGPARYGALLAKTSGPAGRLGVRVGVGAAEGAVGSAVLEPINYSLAQTLGDDYTAYNSFMNIAFGAGFAGTISGGGGAIADAMGKGIGAIQAIPKSQRAEILQAATQKLLRDGTVDIGPIVNAAVRRNLLYDLNEINTIPGLRNTANTGKVFGLPSVKAADALADDLSIANARISNLEVELSRGQKLNQYERGLNEYDRLFETEPKTPAEAAFKERKKVALDRRYGKNFESEARNYLAYKEAADQLVIETNSKKIKKLKNRLKELDKPFDGRLAKAYERRDAFDLAAAETEIAGLRADVAATVQRKTLDMKRQAAMDYIKAADDFSRGSDNTVMVKAEAEVYKIDQELSAIKPQDLDTRAVELDDEIANYKELDKEFMSRNPETVFDEIDDAEFDMKEVVSSARNFAKCLLR